jgi:hypothetical protein
MSLTGIILGPITGIDADIDIVAGAFQVLIMLVVLSSRILKKEAGPRQ